MRWTPEQDKELMDQVTGYIGDMNRDWDLNATEVTKNWFLGQWRERAVLSHLQEATGRLRTGPEGFWKRYQHLKKCYVCDDCGSHRLLTEMAIFVGETSTCNDCWDKKAKGSS